jgi:hypothetical protein
MAITDRTESHIHPEDGIREDLPCLEGSIGRADPGVVTH